MDREAAQLTGTPGAGELGASRGGEGRWLAVTRTAAVMLAQPWLTQANAKRPTPANLRVVELDLSVCGAMLGFANFSGWLVRSKVLPGSPVQVTDCPGAMRTTLGV